VRTHTHTHTNSFMEPFKFVVHQGIYTVHLGIFRAFI